MSGDPGKTEKEESVGRIGKAKGRLQQSLPEIPQRIRTSSAVEIAQSIFRQFADDIQLKDLLAKAESLVAKAASTDTAPAATFRDVTPANESTKTAGAKKTPSKGARPRKAAPKKTSSKKTKKPAPKRKAKTRS